MCLCYTSILALKITLLPLSKLQNLKSSWKLVFDWNCSVVANFRWKEQEDEEEKEKEKDKQLYSYVQTWCSIYNDTVLTLLCIEMICFQLSPNMDEISNHDFAYIK